MNYNHYLLFIIIHIGKKGHKPVSPAQYKNHIIKFTDDNCQI